MRAPTGIDIQMVNAIVERIRPYLAGERPEIQGAVLAELLSMWIAGHYQMGTATMDRMLEWHTEMVRRLVPIDVEFLKAGPQGAK